MIGALLALALTLAAPAPVSPTPTPELDDEEVEDAEIKQPAITFDHTRRSLPDMAIVPSLGIGGFIAEDRSGDTIGGTHLWAGVMFHPAPSEFGPFMGMGMSFDGRGSDDAWYGMAEMRYGVAWLTNPNKYESAIFPGFAAYAIAGWRPERGTRGLYRAGGGIASPLLFASTLSEVCIPLPTMAELVMDAPEGRFSSDHSRTVFRMGWQF